MDKNCISYYAKKNPFSLITFNSIVFRKKVNQFLMISVFRQVYFPNCLYKIISRKCTENLRASKKLYGKKTLRLIKNIKNQSLSFYIQFKFRLFN